jgi:hypothetical protein
VDRIELRDDVRVLVEAGRKPVIRGEAPSEAHEGPHDRNVDGDRAIAV